MGTLLLIGRMGTPAEDMDSCVVALAGVGEAPFRAETDAPDEIWRKWGVCALSDSGVDDLRVRREWYSGIGLSGGGGQDRHSALRPGTRCWT